MRVTPKLKHSDETTMQNRAIRKGCARLAKKVSEQRNKVFVFIRAR